MKTAQRKPRVVQVITRLIVGGAQLSTIDLCAGLREHYDVHIVSGPQTGPEGSLHRQAAEVAPLTIAPSLRREMSPRWDPVVIPALRRTLVRIAPAIIHTHSSKAGIVGRLAARSLEARVAHTVHGWGQTPADPLWRRAMFVGLERAAARHCDALIAVSADVRDEGLASGIGSPQLYRVIPEGVDYVPLDGNYPRARAAARRELGIAPDADVVGWVGRFTDQKDPDTLTAALVSLLNERRGLRAVLIGDGPLRSDVERALGRGGVKDRVQLAGLRPAARALMPAFDVMLHPSRWEGQPRVIQEAIAERVPVVAADVNGVRGLVLADKTGTIVRAGAPADMAAAARRILDDTQLRAPIAQEDIQALREEHGREVAIALHLKLYEALLRHGGG